MCHTMLRMTRFEDVYKTLYLVKTSMVIATGYFQPHSQKLYRDHPNPKNNELYNLTLALVLLLRITDLYVFLVTVVVQSTVIPVYTMIALMTRDISSSISQFRSDVFYSLFVAPRGTVSGRSGLLTSK